jgi:chaperonin cofactor prefoldin
MWFKKPESEVNLELQNKIKALEAEVRLLESELRHMNSCVVSLEKELKKIFQNYSARKERIQD